MIFINSLLTLQKEIEKVKERRAQRELEKQQWEEEKARQQREQDSLSYQDWEKKEDEVFCLLVDQS